MPVAAITTLETYLGAFGNAFIMVGDPFTLDGLSILGMKEGEIRVEFNPTYNDLTFPEQTGDAIWERGVKMGNVRVTIPMIIKDPALYATVSPTAESNMGSDLQVDVTTTSLVLVTEADFGVGNWGYPQPAGPWAPAAPTATAWFWHGHFERSELGYRDEDKGKLVRDVVFQSMRAPDSVGLPDGHRIFTLGDPVSQGITTLDI